MIPGQTGTAGALRPAQRLAYLDTWRFFAVAAVIVCHVITRMVARGVVPADSWIGQLARLGPLGVAIFFFLSGYLICRGLLHERETTGTVSLKAFYVRRAYRILPALAIYLAVLAILGPGLRWIGVTPAQLTHSALFLCNIRITDGGCSWWAGHTWSLGFEEQFYIVFPLLFVLWGVKRSAKHRWLPWMALILLACSGILVRALTRGFPVYYAANAAFLATGCCAATLQPQLRNLADKVGATAWLTLLAAALGLFLFLPLHLYSIIYLAMPLPILFFVSSTPLQQPAVRRIFESDTMGYLGRMSYTVYLWQQLALGEWRFIPTPLIPLLILPVFYWAHWSWHHIEEPLIRTGRELSGRIKRADTIPRTLRA